jgi:tetratricopeptide (TPR) repeat protein
MQDQAFAVQGGNSLLEIFFAQGKEYQEQGEWDKALAEFNHVLEMNPHYAPAYAMRGYCYYYMDKMEQAIAEHTKALEVDPTYVEAYGYRSGCWIALKKFDKAQRDIEQIRKINPNARGLYYSRRADLFASQGDSEGELADYTKAIELDPTYGEAYFVRGQLLMFRKQYQFALHDFNQAIALKVRKIYCAYYFRGIVYARMEQWQASLADFATCIQMSADSPEPYLHRAEILLGLEQPQAALAEYAALLAHDSNHVRALFERADVLMSLEQYKAALSDYDRLISLAPSEPEPYFLRGVAYHRLGEHQAAMQNLQMTLRLKPYFFPALMSIGAIYMEFGMLSEAIAAYTTAIEANGTNAYVYHNRGTAYRLAGQLKAAEKDFAKVAKLNPQEFRPVSLTGAGQDAKMGGMAQPKSKFKFWH